MDADTRVAAVFRELLENAGEDEDTGQIDIDIQSLSYSVNVSITDDGSGLPADQRELLRSETFPEFDDPSTGFGLQIVRILVYEYQGETSPTVNTVLQTQQCTPMRSA